MNTLDSSIPNTIHLFEKLKEDLVLNLVQEIKFQPNLCQLPITTQDDEITVDARDRSAHVLRCLKVVFDLSSDVFFVAINLMDRFLTKMKARQKHMDCISVSAFYIAAVQLSPVVDGDHRFIDRLVSISQCGCTTDDLKRMSQVIRNKLEWVPGTQPITTLTFLQLFNNMFHAVAAQFHLGDVYASVVKISELILMLEMVACDGSCASLRPSVVALVLLCTYLDTTVNRLNANANGNASVPSTHDTATVPPHQVLRDKFALFTKWLQNECNISKQSFYFTRGAVDVILSKYNAQEQTPYKQNLIWRVSKSTARVLRPTAKFRSELPVIAEHTPVPSPSKIRKSRKYTRRHGNKRR